MDSSCSVCGKADYVYQYGSTSQPVRCFYSNCGERMHVRCQLQHTVQKHLEPRMKKTTKD